MDERKVLYANRFRVTVGDLETQLLFELESPVVNEETGEIIGVETQSVADIRMNSKLAKQLCNALPEQLNEYEKVFGPLN